MSNDSKDADRRGEIPELTKKLGILDQYVGEDPKITARLEDILAQLPENLVTNLHSRMTNQLQIARAGYDRFASEHGISKAEKRLLDSLVNGMTVVQHAEANGISVNTARTHMRRLLDKTGSKGQLDLVGKVNRLLNGGG